MSTNWRNSLVAVAQIDLFGAFCGVIAGRPGSP
jgi:hypothetical protein